MRMIVRYKNILIPIAAVVLASIISVSCKKKDDTPTKEFMNGNVTFSGICPFQEVGAKKVPVHVKGVYHPLGKATSIGFKLESCSDTLSTKYDPDKGADFDVDIPSDPGTYKLNVYVIPEDSDAYYTTSASFTVVAVDAKKSVSGFDYKGATFTDDRGSKPVTYNYETVGGVQWMSRNLSYDGAGQSYYSPVMDYSWGRYYTWEEAKTACPSGWELPSDQDFVDLANALDPGKDYKTGADCAEAAGAFMVLSYFNSERLWPYSPFIKIPSDPKFYALPAGFLNIAETDPDFKYHGFYDLALFWTGDADPDHDGQAIYRHINLDSNILMKGSADVASMAMSVRCIKK